MTAVLLIASACFFVLAVHPFTIYPLSLLLLRALGVTDAARGNRTATAAPRPLRFAICMCAYNEERVIGQKMRNLMQLLEREPGLQILVYVDASSDRTAQLLQPYADRIFLHVSAERHGKTCGMNLLSARADADVLVFTDANVMLDPACLDDLRRHFADPQIGCVCGNLNYINGDASITAASGSLYWRFEEALKRLESQTGSMIVADGSIFAVRRELRHAPPDHIIDDMYVSLMTLIDGHRVIQAPDVRAYEESVAKSSEEFNRKIRIACQAFNVHRLLWPRLRRLDWLTRYKYVSHKLLRWLSIFFLGIAALAFVAALVSAGYPMIALGVVVAATLCGLLGHLWSIRPFAQVVDLLLALLGAGLGVLRSLRGERFQTWTPADSIRGGAK
ncbi:MAG TPA: glycosyltransferase [Povalibacter sp.]|uniref:glycosyltransferase n=1 Tax=Povalibacter sp. TaxID=1962978 RepID=UPI002C80698B|nr:glycosyltransferase [Povalibacter sp.]HMN45099.1 glycosyltransferase [Povalibacter sp.]